MHVRNMGNPNYVASSTHRLREAFTKVFAEHYDQETAEVLAEIHAIFHAKFAQAMAAGPGHEPGEEKLLTDYSTTKMQAAVRRARKWDVMPPGPELDALYDEIVDMVHSAGDLSITEILNASVLIGADPGVVRAAVARLMKEGRIERVENNKVGRYRCTTTTPRIG